MVLVALESLTVSGVRGNPHFSLSTVHIAPEPGRRAVKKWALAAAREGCRPGEGRVYGSQKKVMSRGASERYGC